MFALITPQMKSLEEGYKYLGSESTFVVLSVLPAAVTSQPGVHKDLRSTTYWVCIVKRLKVKSG